MSGEERQQTKDYSAEVKAAIPTIAESVKNNVHSLLLVMTDWLLV
jgi:hypothetical protein